MFACVNLCSIVLENLFTHVYSCLPMLVVFTYVYSCLLVFTHAYSCLPMFTILTTV